MAKRDLRSELDDFDGEYPESWIPKVGDILVGRLLRYTSGFTAYGECPIVVIEDEKTNELRSVWLVHAVLRNEFQRKRPKLGERIGIKRLPDSRKRYKLYLLLVDREEPDVPDFERFAPAGDVPPDEVSELTDDDLQL